MYHTLILVPPWRLVCLIAATIILCFSFQIKIWPARRSLLVLIAAGIGTIGTTRPMSGHDETAHLSMWQKALEIENVPHRLPEIEFNHKVYDLMSSENFLKLHGTMPPDPSICPHMILKSCGIGDRPTNLYRTYISYIRFFVGDDFVPVKPKKVIYFARLLHFVMLLLLGIFITNIKSPQNIDAIVGVVILTGGFWGQFATLTNDVPMFFLGFVGLCSIVVLAAESFTSTRITFCIIWAILFVTLRKVDISAVATILPLTIALTLLAMSCFPPNWKTFFSLDQVRRNSKFNMYLPLTLTISILFLAPEILGFLKNQLPNFNLLKTFANAGSGLIDEIETLNNLVNSTFLDNLLTLKRYLVSTSGSFVWGHSYYPVWMQSIWVALWLLGFFLFSKAPVDQTPLLRVKTFVISIGIGLSLLCICAVGVKYVAMDVVTSMSFAKPRLTAPLLALTLFPLYTSLLWLRRRSKDDFVFVRILSVVTVYQLWLQLRLYYI